MFPVVPPLRTCPPYQVVNILRARAYLLDFYFKLLKRHLAFSMCSVNIRWMKEKHFCAAQP